MARRNPRDYFVHDRYLGGFLDFGSLKTAARYAKHKFGCAPAGDCVFIEEDEAMVTVNSARPHLARRVGALRNPRRGRRNPSRSRNPFNATKPAEWATMSKSLRKSWNRKHWRPEQYKCDLALKKEATRMARRAERSGSGLLTLAERMAKATNPMTETELARRIDSDPTVRELMRYDGLASAYKRASPSQRIRIFEKLSSAAEHGRSVRRTNPGRPKRRRARIERERRKWSQLPGRDRRRIEREETSLGFAVNPRRRNRRR